jgi:hypothetical protein
MSFIEGVPMLIAPKDVARHLDKLFKTEFGGSKTGRYTISKANLRLLAGRDSLQASIVMKVMAAAVVNHSLLLVPLDGTIETAKNFGLMKSSPDWRTVPTKQVAAHARAA